MKHVDDKFLRQAREILETAFDEYDRSQTSSTASQPPDNSKMTIRFTGNRISTAKMLMACAAELLATGETKLVIRKKP